MLTVEIKVNGALIEYLYIVNVTPLERQVDRILETEKEIKDIYKYEHYDAGEGTIDGKIHHTRNDGALVLVKKVIDKAIKQRRKK